MSNLLIPNSVLPTTSRLVRVVDLSDLDISRMFQLLSLHFSGVSREQFISDLANKNYAILLERDKDLVGFTTILAYETTFDNEPLSVIYSGDTIVSPVAWNSPVLSRSWIESVAKIRLAFPRGPYVWMLITSGFRTYRFLPVFWREFYPRHDCQTPTRTKRMIDQIATDRFGPRYSAAEGIVRLAHPQALKNHLADIPEHRRLNPDIEFFITQNPGNVHGDELVCITELKPENLTTAGRRMAASAGNW